jgi:hypothetical protein
MRTHVGSLDMLPLRLTPRAGGLFTSARLPRPITASRISQLLLPSLHQFIAPPRDFWSSPAFQYGNDINAPSIVAVNDDTVTEGEHSNNPKPFY